MAHQQIVNGVLFRSVMLAQAEISQCKYHVFSRLPSDSNFSVSCASARQFQLFAMKETDLLVMCQPAYLFRQPVFSGASS